MAVFKIAYLTYQTFYLGLLRPFAVGFCPLRQRQNTPETVLPNVLLWVLQFFSILFNFTNFYFTKSKLFFYFYNIFYFYYNISNLIYILFWKFVVYSFPISDWLKAPVLLYLRKNHMWLIRKVELCAIIWLIIMLKNRLIFRNTLYDFSYMINHVMYFLTFKKL